MSEFGIGPEFVSSANAVAEFLALDQFRQGRRARHFDMVVLAGNAILSTAAAAFEQARVAQTPVLITGGIGHSTVLLAEAVAKRHGDIAVRNRPEAEILRDIAIRIHGLEEAQILVEPASTNCGENGLFSWRFLDERGLRPGVALLVQDPLMQRRTDASFRHAWRESSWRTEFINWPTFVPKLERFDGAAGYAVGLPEPLWSGRRFMSLLLGEIPRLRDDESGYGPRGMGFIAHVDIPGDVERHFQRLVACFENEAPALSRRIG
jgi:uncharacterized SAM-binding protein YcdF (DUF218 family)